MPAGCNSPMDLGRLLNSHRSIRQYKPDPIDPDLIQRVCGDAIAGASSSGNLNSVTMVLTREAARKEKLCEFHCGQEMVIQAPLVITFCADWFRTREWLRQRSARDNFNNFIGYHVAAFDAMIVAQNVCLGFQSEGLGICYMGTTLYSMSQIADFLELPDTCVPITTIVVGHPDENPAKRDRLPMQAFLHEERYRLPDDREIDELYEQREVRGWQRYMSVPEIKARIEERGIKSLAEYYTSPVKYDPDEFQEDSERIRQLLVRKSFLP